MAEAQVIAPTQTVVDTQERTTSPTVKLKLRKPKSDKKVKWSEETVDNEHMGKKKSKCCCIYEKPRLFGESSSEDEDDECGHCRGHKKKCYQSLPKASDNGPQGAEGGPYNEGGS